MINLLLFCKQFISSYKPKILILLETWITSKKADSVIRRLGFHFNYRQEAEGFSGGIWLLWNDDSIKLSILLSHKQIVHASICSIFFIGFISAIYRSPINSHSKLL